MDWTPYTPVAKTKHVTFSGVIVTYYIPYEARRGTWVSDQYWFHRRCQQIGNMLEPILRHHVRKTMVIN